MSRKKPLVVRETVSLYEAKTHLSSLVERAARGEEIVIAESGKPKARLVSKRCRGSIAIRSTGSSWLRRSQKG